MRCENRVNFEEEIKSGNAGWCEYCRDNLESITHGRMKK